MTDGKPTRLSLDRAQLVIVDIQEKLLPFITDHERVVRQSERMVRAAAALELPMILSEQYPQGLGVTTPLIADAVEGATHATKMTFSFCADADCREKLVTLERPQVLLIGIETHVCVQQTALDLLDMGMQPVVLADAVGSRRELDWRVALDRMRAAGAVVTTVESVIFEMVHASDSELFKRILPIVK